MRLEKIIYLSFIGLSFFRPIDANANRLDFDKDEVENIVRETALNYGVDPLLASAVAYHESKYDPMAISHKGAVGVMQLMPLAAAEWGVENRYDVHDNIKGGVKGLKILTKRYTGNLRAAIAAYHSGYPIVDRAIRKHGDNWFNEVGKRTKNYVNVVLKTYSESEWMRRPGIEPGSLPWQGNILTV